MRSTSAATIASLLLFTISLATPCLAEEGAAEGAAAGATTGAAAGEAAVAEAAVVASTSPSSAAEARELAGGYHLGDQVVALVDFESTSGKISKGDIGTAVAKGSAPNTILCNFVNHEGFEASFAQIGASSTVLNGGYHFGDKVVALIDWEGASGGITRGDVGIVLDQGRGAEGLVVDFPRLKRLSVLIAQIGRVGAPLNGGYGVGDKVVSLIDWAGSAGKISRGDVGIALARGNGEKGIVVDFPGIKNLNIMLHQIERAGAPSPSTAAAQPPVAKEDAAVAAPAPAPVPAAPAPAPEAPAPAAESQVAALQGSEAAAAPQERRAGAEAEAEAGRNAAAAAPAGGEAMAASEAEGAAAAAPQAEKEAEKEAAEKEGDLAALQGLASSLSQKVAQKKEAAAAAEALREEDSMQGLATSLAKKLEQAKENRLTSEQEAMPARRHVLKADAWPTDKAAVDDSKPSMFQRLMGPLLGKSRPSDAEVEALSLVQVGAKVTKKPLLSGKKRHDEL